MRCCFEDECVWVTSFVRAKLATFRVGFVVDLHSDAVFVLVCVCCSQGDVWI